MIHDRIHCIVKDVLDDECGSGIIMLQYADDTLF
jgi:hypothetical protein